MKYLIKYKTSKLNVCLKIPLEFSINFLFVKLYQLFKTEMKQKNFDIASYFLDISEVGAHICSYFTFDGYLAYIL